MPPLARTLALTALGAIAGALLGVLILGAAGALVAVVPPTVVGLWQAWRGHRRDQSIHERIRSLEPADGAFIDELQDVAAWRGDGRLSR